MAGGLGSSCTYVPNGHFRRGSRTTLRRGAGAATPASQRGTAGVAADRRWSGGPRQLHMHPKGDCRCGSRSALGRGAGLAAPVSERETGSKSALGRGARTGAAKSRRWTVEWQPVGAAAGGWGSCTCVPKGDCRVAAGQRCDGGLGQLHLCPKGGLRAWQQVGAGATGWGSCACIP